jgi:hypothetical protein
VRDKNKKYIFIGFPISAKKREIFFILRQNLLAAMIKIYGGMNEWG